MGADIGIRFLAGLSWRLIPATLTMSWPGYCFFNALVMTATLSSEVQKRMDGVLKGKMTFTPDRSWYRVRLFAHRPCHLASLRSEERRVGKECVSRCRYRGSPN